MSDLVGTLFDRNVNKCVVYMNFEDKRLRFALLSMREFSRHSSPRTRKHVLANVGKLSLVWLRLNE